MYTHTYICIYNIYLFILKIRDLMMGKSSENQRRVCGAEYAGTHVPVSQHLGHKFEASQTRKTTNGLEMLQ